MTFSSGLVLAVIATASWIVLPTALLLGLLIVMLPAYAATWMVPLLQTRRAKQANRSATPPQ